MKKLLIASALFLSANVINATPILGGYLGHHVIVGGEFSYSPFYTSAKDFFTKYNFQYGGNINVIISRRSQFGLDYNMWSLSGNEVFDHSLDATDRVKGTEIGMNIRTFRKNRGGIAPIGKFYDIGMGYAMNKFYPGTDKFGSSFPEFDLSTLTSTAIIPHVAFGTQMVFWNRVVANTGIRFAYPLTLSNNGPTNFMERRLSNKDYASVFFGIGVLL